MFDELDDDTRQAARLVVERWATGDLAEAVRALDTALHAFDKAEANEESKSSTIFGLPIENRGITFDDLLAEDED